LDCGTKAKFSLLRTGCQTLNTGHSFIAEIIHLSVCNLFDSEAIIATLKEMDMRVVLGSDHAGYELKQQILDYVKELGHEILDVGTHDGSSVDYPDFAEAVGTAIIDNKADRGILICGSGVGSVIAVNKIPGIRAGICHDCYSAHQGVEHDNMNVLVMGARIIAIALAQDLVKLFLDAQFTMESRHQRRLAKVKALENRFLKK
jgi:RpiB/LacA/LacB family sugar-phosphate isomerase